MNRSGIASVLGAAIMSFAAVAVPRPAFPEEEPGPWARMTLHYANVTDSDPNPSFQRWLYLENGLTVLTRHVFLDASMPMAVVFVDAIAGAIKFLAGGGDSIPLMSALNPGPEEPGWISIFEVVGGPQIAQFGAVRIGAGVHFEYSWVGGYFDRERVNTTPVDFGVAGNIWLDLPGFDGTLRVMAGNGFHRFGKWNPYFGLAPTVDLPIAGMLAVHFSGSLAVRRLDYTKFEARWINDIPTSLVRVAPWATTWAFDVGPSLRF